jgi:hypothetical protein
MCAGIAVVAGVWTTGVLGSLLDCGIDNCNAITS